MRCGHRCLVFCLSFLCVAGAQAQDDIAVTREILVSAQMPPELRGAVHTTALSPDGRYAYIIGPSAQVAPPPGGGMAGNVLRSPTTLLKVDAMTLQPIKQLAVGGRTHHAQVFQDRYLLIDTFVSEPNGLDVFLFDPQGEYNRGTSELARQLVCSSGHDGMFLVAIALQGLIPPGTTVGRRAA